MNGPITRLSQATVNVKSSCDSGSANGSRTAGDVAVAHRQIEQILPAPVDDRGDQFDQRSRQPLRHVDARAEVDDGEHAVVAEQEVPRVRVGVHAVHQIGGGELEHGQGLGGDGPLLRGPVVDDLAQAHALHPFADQHLR